MNTKRLPVILILFFSLACNVLGGVVPTPTPSPTFTPTRTPTPTVTPTATATPTPIPPAYVPPECEGVAFATLPAETALALPTPAIQANPEVAPDVQARVFEQVVYLVEEAYVYPEFVAGEDWARIKSTYQAKIEAGLDTQTFYTEMKNMIRDLGDEHSFFESPIEVAESEAQLAASAEYSGIGIVGQTLLEKARVAIVTVFSDSSAQHGGLQSHDSILKVDGLPIVENGKARTYLIRGPLCSVVHLTVQSPGGQPRDLWLMRNTIKGGLPVDSRLVSTQDGSRIGYIMLPSFFDNTIPDKVAQALEDFGPLDGLILDNRMNGGGINTVTEEILGYFTSGTLGSFRGREYTRPFKIEPGPIHNSQTVPLIVLVGEDTVSFGEIFSGVLRDSGRARLIGQTTLGNVEAMLGYTLEDGSKLWIASETFDPASSHQNWELTGLVPDVEAFADWDTFTFETDPAIAAALELLGHQ